MPTNPVQNGKGASIMKQGHTANGKFGTSPEMKVKGGNSVRDLNAKAK